MRRSMVAGERRGSFGSAGASGCEISIVVLVLLLLLLLCLDGCGGRKAAGEATFC